MKQLTILIDGSQDDFYKLVRSAIFGKHKKVVCIDTVNCLEDRERDSISEEIESFKLTDHEILMVNFSGREAVAQEIGDEFSDMVVTFSFNKNSGYYIENPACMFLDLISIFDKETE